MWLYQYLQALYPYFGAGNSESAFVPQFFTDVMEETAPTEANPFLDLTPDYVQRIYNGEKNLLPQKATLIKPNLSDNRFQALVDRYVNTPESQLDLITDFEEAGIVFKGSKLGHDLRDLLSKIISGVSRGTDNPSPRKAPRKRKAVTSTFASTVPEDIFIKDHRLYVGADSVELPKDVVLDPNIADHEFVYVEQLCAAFSEHFEKQITSSTVSSDPDCGDEFIEYRQDYYRADALRVMLEYFPDGTDEFGIIKDQTFRGVSSTWRNPVHINGYARLLAVLEQAGRLNLTKSKAASTPGLFGQEEMVGVCHILANDKRLWWCNPDE